MEIRLLQNKTKLTNTQKATNLNHCCIFSMTIFKMIHINMFCIKTGIYHPVHSFLRQTVPQEIWALSSSASARDKYERNIFSYIKRPNSLAERFSVRKLDIVCPRNFSRLQLKVIPMTRIYVPNFVLFERFSRN